MEKENITYKKDLNTRIQQGIVLPNFEQIENERQKLPENNVNFLQKRFKRTIDNYNPSKNYQIYPNDIHQLFPNLYSNFTYPYSSPYHQYYRPIRYFYQRPIHVDKLKIESENKNIEPQYKKKLELPKVKPISVSKWGKPLKMEDVIKTADVVHHPLAKLISPQEFRKKQFEIEELKQQYNKVDPERRKIIRENIRKVWSTVKKLRHMTTFYRVIKQYTKASITHRNLKQTISQASKANLQELSKFLLNKIKSVEAYALEHFSNLFVIDKTRKNKTEDSIFIIKSFIHQVFHDLNTNLAFEEDIPMNIKNIMLNYIGNRQYLPDNFLTSFEFNRLEFDVNLRLNKMTQERQAMMCCFILLYRVLLLEIFKNYSKHFKMLKGLKKSNGDARDFSETNDTVRNENIQYNFNFIMGILHFILKDAFVNTPKIYREYFKETHLFKKFVIDGDSYNSIKSIDDQLQTDENELTLTLPQLPKVLEFVKENYRWINMYKMTVFSFCLNFVEKLKN